MSLLNDKEDHNSSSGSRSSIIIVKSIPSAALSQSELENGLDPLNTNDEGQFNVEKMIFSQELSNNSDMSNSSFEVTSKY